VTTYITLVPYVQYVTFRLQTCLINLQRGTQSVFGAPSLLDLQQNSTTKTTSLTNTDISLVSCERQQ
jgi:hypothetical protein